LTRFTDLDRHASKNSAASMLVYKTTNTILVLASRAAAIQE